ncbi:hypothetical protein Efla_004060 [Eimeria flavescens]
MQASQHKGMKAQCRAVDQHARGSLHLHLRVVGRAFCDVSFASALTSGCVAQSSATALACCSQGSSFGRPGRSVILTERALL